MKKRFLFLPPCCLAALLGIVPVQQGFATVFADYTADFSGTSAPVGWQYLWNAPSDWNGTSASDGSTGAFGNPANYTPLQWNGSNWTSDGDTNNGNGAPSNFLRMNATGGHPGRGSTQGEAGSLTVLNNQDRYAIAAYTIQPSDLPLGYGKVFITGSNVGVNAAAGTVRVDTHVNGGAITKSFTVAGATNRSVDQYLGTLHVGDTLYFGVGPSTSDGNDTFSMGFQLAYPTASDTLLLADYRDDYQNNTMPAGWEYLWNAPSDWNGTSASDGSTGNIASIADYELLSPISNSWRVDGDIDSSNGSPGRFLALNSTGGHPGRGSTQGESGLLNPLNNQDRYVITSYQVPFDGIYSLGNTFFSTVDAGGNGNEVRVFTSQDAINPILSTVFLNGEFNGSFDTFIGNLAAGDKIYVAVGPATTDGNDSFAFDFSVMYQIPEAGTFSLFGLGAFLLRLWRRRG